MGEILLINNAGFGVYGTAEAITASEQLGMMDLNMRGLVDLTLRLLPLLRERGGRVANVASTAAFQPTPFFATYGATKAFVLHWTLALAQELRGSRVAAVAVCPGPTATQFFRRAGMQQGAVGDRLGQTSEQVVQEAWRAIARRRSLVVTGWGNKVLATFGSMLPKRLVTRVSARVMAHFRLKQAQAPISPPRMSAGDVDYPIRACAWPRREQRAGTVRLIEPAEFASWILVEDEDYLVVNKPGDVVCHPSKAGPWSSLVGAAREHTGQDVMHLIFRLDRETSGVVVFARHPALASRLQQAMQRRQVGKCYGALLMGELSAPVTVDQPLGTDVSSPVFVKDTVRPDGKAAVTHFTPLATSDGFTVAKVGLETGRKHQIRAHAQWLGHAVVGDKIYGPDARCYLEFIDHGFTPALAKRLLLPRQALHCAEIDLRPAGVERVFSAPWPEDLRVFARESIGLGELPGLTA